MTRIALALSILLTSSVFAAEPWEGPPFSGDPKSMLAAAEAVRPEKPEEGVVVLLDETIVSFDDAGRSTRVERLLYRVIDESAVDGWASLDAQWQPWYSERPEVDARVISKDGSVHRLDPSSFAVADSEDDANMFSDTRTLSGPLPAVAPGAVVEQTITWRDKNPLSSRFGKAGVSSRQQFGRWVESRHSRLVLEWPDALRLNFVNRTRPAVEPVRTATDGRTRLVFDIGVMPGFGSFEWNVPSDSAQRSYVAWSTGDSWQEVARQYGAVVDEKIGDLGSVERVTRVAVGDATAPRVIAERVVAAIARDIRYAGVEFGEGSIVPRTPGETLKNKYGDCKDKATLLVAMLRKAGVPAHVALVRSGQGYDVEPTLPGLGHFDHVIVVTEGPDPIWIDPTDEFARAGELPESDQDRLALVARPDTTSLTRTPVSDSSAHRIIETREVMLAETGKASIVEISEYTGGEERSMRRHYTSTARKDIGESLESYAKNAYLTKGAPKWSMSDTHDLSTRFRLRLEMSDAGRGVTANGEAAVGIFMSRMVGDLPVELRTADDPDAVEKRKPREYDYVFVTPHTLELHYRIVPPPGYVVRTMPENETVTLGPATLTKKYAADGDVLLADYTFDSGPRRITPAQYEELKKTASKVAEESAFLIYFDQVGRKYLDAGEVGKAVAEFRRVGALHPKEALHQADVALALLSGGMGDAARREARHAIAVEPKSPHGHAALGRVLTQDLIGREFRQGFDLAGSIAAYRKAKELAPQDLSIRADLAVVLQYNSDGIRYGKGAALGEAIDEYVALKKDIEEADDAAIDRELMTLYAYSSRWDDLKKLLAETKDTERKELYQLVAEGASKGPEAALKAAAAIVPARRRDVESTAASVLSLFRYYPAASALLSDAAQGSPNAAQLRQQIDVMRKAVRYEEIRIEASDPKSMMYRVFSELARSGDENAVDPFLESEVRKVFDEDGLRERASKAKPANQQFKQFRRQAGMTAFIVDMALAAIDLQVDGDDNVGYRVRGRNTGDNEMALYLVRENGELRISGQDDLAPALALRALRLADKGELAAARQWLDWARDHVKSGFNEDPLTAEPFATVWTRGRAATLEETRTAAAVLLPDTKLSSEIALPILVAARPGTTVEVQTQIDIALITAYGILEKWPELLATADRLAAAYPESARAFRSGIQALMKLKRSDEARSRAAARLERMPGDSPALHALAEVALDAGQYAAALQYYSQTLDRARPAAMDYNQYAWTALFTESDMDKVVESARQATMIAPDSYAVLNTLAVVYAERGESSAARETLLKSLDQHDNDKLGDADWYVMGRIAENFGIRDAALEAYRRIAKPSGRTSSTWELAQKRIEKLK